MNNSQNDSKKTVMQVLADETGGKSYKAHKYGLDHAERPFIDYSEDTIIWEKTAETDRTINIPRLCRGMFIYGNIKSGQGSEKIHTLY